MKPRQPSNSFAYGLALGGIASVLVAIVVLYPHVYGAPVDWQTTYYSVMALGIALLISALVELRFNALEARLDELLKNRSS